MLFAVFAGRHAELLAKASAEVKVSDIIEIGFGTRSVKVEVLNVEETVKKDEAKDDDSKADDKAQ